MIALCEEQTESEVWKSAENLNMCPTSSWQIHEFKY